LRSDIRNRDGSGYAKSRQYGGIDVRLAFIAWIIGILLSVTSGISPAGARNHQRIQITYLGNAGWQIEGSAKIILVDPYISQFADKKTAESGIDEDADPILLPDITGIDARIHHADYILITHGHADHMLDAPYIAKMTGATIICSDSNANIARAYQVPEDQIIIVKGGEDYAFDGFSLRVIPSLHSPLFKKHYNNNPVAGSTPEGLKAPLHGSAYAEGGTRSYLLRLAGKQIFIMGSMNFIEKEVQGLHPDIAIIASGVSRNENYDYAGRLIRALNYPAIVLPTHWDSYGRTTHEKAIAGAKEFASEIKLVSPKTRVIIPEYFVPNVL
jgi:L-ascorbate metabolism protein UlaG (beta-lactamase superfamily)